MRPLLRDLFWAGVYAWPAWLGGGVFVAHRWLAHPSPSYLDLLCALWCVVSGMWVVNAWGEVQTERRADAVRRGLEEYYREAERLDAERRNGKAVG